LEVVAYRGPDGEGWQESFCPRGPLVLAHRRLAILDLSTAGQQPMTSADGRLSVVYNGEIYNYRELRTELEQIGLVFSTGTDTEVLLAAYGQWGEDCLRRFNGMFAFVLWDRDNSLLFAARDPFGIKPLYFWRSNAGIAFASEIKQFTVCPGFTPRLNGAAATDFLVNAVFDHGDATLFADVYQLRGGESLRLSVADCTAEPMVRRWFALPPGGSRQLAPDVAAEAVATAFADAVRLRLRADVPIGTCLSGGLDSSSIVCTLARQGVVPAVVSACYQQDRDIDERPYIQAVAQATGATVHAVFPTAEGLADTLDSLLFHQETPLASTSPFAQWSVFAEARRQGLTVMLDGQGADELLGGYHSAFAAFAAGLLRRGRLWAAVTSLRYRRNRHDVGVPRQMAEILSAWQRPLVHRLRGLNRPSWLADSALAAPPLPATPSLEAWSESLLATNLPMLLHYEDRNSMAHGIEARLPFLDRDLANLLFSLGGDLKIAGGETKAILRRAMGPVLPSLVCRRQDKIGFATPESRWLLGPMRPLVLAGLQDAGRRFPHLLAGAEIGRLCRDLEGRREGALPPDIWRIATLGAFGRIFGMQA